MTYEQWGEQLEVDDERVRALTEINFNLRAEVARRYGAGLPGLESRGSVADLAYHNLTHTKQAVEAVRQMAEALDLNEYDALIAEAAATAHDIVQLKPRGVMERESANHLAELMREYGLPEDDIHIATLAVLGTETIVQQGHILDQTVHYQTYPSQRAEKIARIVACADLAGLYSPRGPYMSHRIYQEYEGIAFSDEPSLANLPAFQESVMHLAQTYQFPHPLGEDLFGGLRDTVTAYHEDVLKQLQTGQLTDWATVLEQDEAFAATYE